MEKTNSHKCPHCNSEIKKNTKFCSNCGKKIPDKKFCPKCKRKYSNDQDYCIKDGTKLEIIRDYIEGTEQNTPITSLHLNPVQYFFKKLIRGGFGLAKTYWLFGVLWVTIYNSILFFDPNNKLSLWLISAIISIIYMPIVYIGTWRAANKYLGLRIFPILAKIVVIISPLTLIFPLSLILNTINDDWVYNPKAIENLVIIDDKQKQHSPNRDFIIDRDNVLKHINYRSFNSNSTENFYWYENENGPHHYIKIKDIGFWTYTLLYKKSNDVYYTVIDTIRMIIEDIGAIELKDGGKRFLIIGDYYPYVSGRKVDRHLLLFNPITSDLVGLKLSIDHYPPNWIPELTFSENITNNSFILEKEFLDALKYHYGFEDESEVEKLRGTGRWEEYFWIKDNGTTMDGYLKINEFDYTQEVKKDTDDVVIGNTLYKSYFKGNIVGYNTSTKKRFIIYQPSDSYNSAHVLKSNPFLILGTGGDGLVIINTETLYIWRYPEFGVAYPILLNDNELKVSGWGYFGPDSEGASYDSKIVALPTH